MGIENTFIHFFHYVVGVLIIDLCKYAVSHSRACDIDMLGCDLKSEVSHSKKQHIWYILIDFRRVILTKDYPSWYFWWILIWIFFSLACWTFSLSVFEWSAGMLSQRNTMHQWDNWWSQHEGTASDMAERNTMAAVSSPNMITSLQLENDTHLV